MASIIPGADSNALKRVTTSSDAKIKIGNFEIPVAMDDSVNPNTMKWVKYSAGIDTSSTASTDGFITYNAGYSIGTMPSIKIIKMLSPLPNPLSVIYSYDSLRAIHRMRFNYTGGMAQDIEATDELIRSMAIGGETKMIPLDNSTQLVKSALENKTREDAREWLRKTLIWFYKERHKEPKEAWKYIINVFRAYQTGPMVATSEAKRLRELFEPTPKAELPF